MRATFNEELAKEIYRRFPHVEEIECYKLCYSLTSVGRSANLGMELLKQCKNTEYKKLQREVFKHNLRDIQTLLTVKRSCIGVWWHQHFFGSQLTPVAERLNSSPDYMYLVIISAGCLGQEITRSSEKDFTFGRYLLIPEDRDLESCVFLEAVFFGESFHNRTYLPKHVIRIGQPHGLDIPLDHAIVKYGGGWIFDYVLCPMKEPEKPADHYYNVFPRPIIEHASTNVCAIPAGYPKLDSFFQASKSRKVQKRIIYHISLWEVETEAVRKNVGATLGILLKNFDNREVLFRPDQVDIENPELIQSIAAWIEHPRFKFSKASSYIDDYADAELLVTHRLTTAHTFSFATGRAIIAFQPDMLGHSDKKVEQTDAGYLVFNEEQLVNKVQQVLSKPEAERDRIRSYMERTIHCPGRAVDYIMDNLKTILRRECLAEWSCFHLFDPTDQTHAEEQVLKCLENSTRWKTLGTNLAETTIEYFPDNVQYRLIAADYYSRFSNPFRHTFYFRGWYQAVSHIAKAIDMCSEQEPELNKELHDWIVQKGMHMAHCVKWYVCRQENPEFGDDIDDIIRRFCIEDEAGEAFKKYPFYMELIWHVRKPIQVMKRFMRFLGYSGE